MIYNIHKISVLLKIIRIILKLVFSNVFSKRGIDFYVFKEKSFLSQYIIMKSLRLEKGKVIEENIINDVRNIFRIKSK